jgi:hypothetical protein
VTDVTQVSWYCSELLAANAGYVSAPVVGSKGCFELMLLKKSATVYIERFPWVALPLTEACERLVERSERSIFWPAVG